MSTIEESLKAAWLDNGGSEAGFEGTKARLISDYRHQATIKAALDGTGRKPNMNQIIRDQLRERRDDNPERLFRKGDAAA